MLDDKHFLGITFPENNQFRGGSKLQDELEEVCGDLGGLYDGYGTDGTEIDLFLYVPDAKVLLSRVLPLLKGEDFTSRAKISLRCGPVGTSEMKFSVLDVPAEALPSRC